MKKIAISLLLVFLLSSCFHNKQEPQNTPEVENNTPNELEIIEEGGTDEPTTPSEDTPAETPKQTPTQTPETPAEPESQDPISPEEEDQIVEDTIQDIEDIFKLLETE